MVLASLLLALDVASLVRDLDHDEYEVRRQAFVELVKAGKAALPALHEAARSGPSLEVRDAAGRIVDRVIERIRDDFIVERSAEPGMRRCGGLSFESRPHVERRLEELAARLPDCELIVGTFSCMHRAPICSGTWVSALSRDDGEIFTVWKQAYREKGLTPGDPALLARHLRPVRDAAEGAALAELLAGPGATAEFDADGRLTGLKKGD